MEYEGQICRPPMEKSSFMLPVAVGCSYNRCTFCSLFKHLSYRELPLEQVEREILRVKEIGGKPKSIFLGDGNAFGIATDRLMKILDMINTHLPGCEMVNMDATITNISQKSDEELRRLYNAGVRRLYLGIETGWDKVLAFTKKGHTLTQAYEQIERMQNAGLIFNAHIMTGIAGSGNGIENAERTAEFFNLTKPERITNFSLFLWTKSQLYKDYQAGLFSPANELENLIEERRLIELLDVPNLVYDGFHDCVLFRLRGTLPADKEKMLAKLDSKIAELQAQEPQYAIV